MAVYFIVHGTVTDQALLTEYMTAAGASGGLVPMKVLTIDTDCQAIEGEPPGTRTVILEFDSEDDFRTWYDSPAYQEALPKRLGATTGFGLLAKGL